jgi:hypothetical protein
MSNVVERGDFYQTMKKRPKMALIRIIKFLTRITCLLTGVIQRNKERRVILHQSINIEFCDIDHYYSLIQIIYHENACSACGFFCRFFECG